MLIDDYKKDKYYLLLEKYFPKFNENTKHSILLDETKWPECSDEELEIRLKELKGKFKKGSWYHSQGTHNEFAEIIRQSSRNTGDVGLIRDGALARSIRAVNDIVSSRNARILNTRVQEETTTNVFEAWGRRNINSRWNTSTDPWTMEEEQPDGTWLAVDLLNGIPDDTPPPIQIPDDEEFQNPDGN